MATEDNFKDYFITEFVEDYQDGRMSRRDALARLAGLTGSMGAAVALLAGCAPAAPPPPPPVAPPAAPPAAAPVAPTTTPAGPGVSETDPDLVSGMVQFPGPAGQLIAYVSRPKGNGPYPAVMICHENRGLNDPNPDIARRFAKSGYVGLALDLVSREGGTAKVDPAQIPAALGRPTSDHVADFQAAMKYLQEQPFVNRNAIGMTGFCFGGGITWEVAVSTPELKAAVPYYGRVPTREGLEKIKAAVLFIHAETDNNINSRIPEADEVLKQPGKTYERVTYPGTEHGFFNNLSQRHNAEGARQAWAKTLDWYAKYLKA